MIQIAKVFKFDSNTFNKSNNSNLQVSGNLALKSLGHAHPEAVQEISKKIDKSKEKFDKQLDKEVINHVDAESSKEIAHLSVLHQDIEELYNVTNKAKTANESEYKEFIKNLNKRQSIAGKEARQIRKYVKRIINPIKHLIAVGNAQKKIQLGVIKRNPNTEKSRIAQNKIAKYDEIAGSVEKLLATETAIEDRLMFFAARGGKLDKDVHKLVGGMSHHEKQQALQSLESETSEDAKEIMQGIKGSISNIQLLPRMGRMLKVALLAIMIGTSVNVANLRADDLGNAHQISYEQPAETVEQVIQRHIVEAFSSKYNKFLGSLWNDPSIAVRDSIYLTQGADTNSSHDDTFVIVKHVMQSIPRSSYVSTITRYFAASLSREVLHGMASTGTIKFDNIDVQASPNGGGFQLTASISRERFENEVIYPYLQMLVEYAMEQENNN